MDSITREEVERVARTLHQSPSAVKVGSVALLDGELFLITDLGNGRRWTVKNSAGEVTKVPKPTEYVVTIPALQRDANPACRVCNDNPLLVCGACGA